MTNKATNNAAVAIVHSTRCRRPAPMLRLSWAGRPEAWCPECGRHAELTTPTNPERTAP